VIPVVSMLDRTAAVLGLGRTGRSACRALTEGGARVWAWDDDAPRRLDAAGSGVRIVDLDICNWRRVDRLVLSPGIPLRHPRPHKVVQSARRAGVEITGDIELLVENQPARRIVGITGTNGKSTTTALAAELLRAGGRGVQLGGNIGLPVLDLLPKPVEDIYVLELSSYQLELTEHLACSVAVILNLSPDHLDRHGGMAGYARAKRRILRNQQAKDWAIVGVDDDHGRELVASLRSHRRQRVLPISGQPAVDAAVYVQGGVLHDAIDGHPGEAVADLRAIESLPGTHNWQNAAAAYAVARVHGVPAAAALDGMRRFRGLPHRMELAGTLGNVRFVNDSKATNPEAAAKSLGCYGAAYWIAGGRPKDGGFASLAPALVGVRRAYLIGEAEAQLADFLDGRVSYARCGDLASAVREAAADARREGIADAVVLLAPACASFDQFANFEARGDAFKAQVAELAGRTVDGGGGESA
jgi:UDP-N-acetylmuramoylalanine--D-glutamate ligase